MRVSTKYNFVFLCMPKCASTSIEKALTPYSQLKTYRDTKLKHTNYRKYKRFLKPFFNNDKLEVVCLMREPISWLHSWYRYRCRSEIKESPNYCGDLTFQEWVEEYLSKKRPSRSRIGVQNSFLKNNKGEIGVDKIFKYEELEELKKYFEEKIGKKLDFPRMNASPKIDYELDIETEKQLKKHLQVDYEIYNSLGKIGLIK